jgi:hypothetical protein
MTFKSIMFGLIVFLLAITAVSGQSAIAEMNIPALIKECGDNQRAMDKRVFEYSFTTREISHGLDRRGEPTKEVVQVFENYPRNENSAKIALSKSGKIVSEKNIAKQREKAAKLLEKDEQERARQDANAPERESGISINQTDKKKIYFKIYNFLRADEFYNSRRETLNGREMIVLDFKPRPDLPELSPLISSIKVLVGRVWIDAEQKVVARLEAWEPSVAGNNRNANGSAEPEVVLQYSLLPENIWLLSGARVNMLKNPALFNNVLIDWKFENINFHHFETEVKSYNADKRNP